MALFPTPRGRSGRARQIPVEDPLAVIPEEAEEKEEEPEEAEEDAEVFTRRSIQHTNAWMFCLRH